MPSPRHHRHHRHIALALILTAHVSAQNFVDLDFSQHVQPTNGLYPNNSTLGPEFYLGSSFDFVNVGTSNGSAIDARVTLRGAVGAYELVGWLPHYNDSPGQNSDDLGVYYRYTGASTGLTGGIGYTLSFYEGGGNFTTPATLDDVRILIYDHDGEPGQSESIRTYVEDGFTGYQLHNASGIHAHDENSTFRFDSRGSNHSETGPEGGFIAYYQNASEIRFDMFSTTNTDLPFGQYGVFAGLDGNLSLTDPQTANFGGFVAVPEPSLASFAAVAASLVLFRRRVSRH